MDGWPSNSLLTLFIYLQRSDNILGGSDVSRDVFAWDRGQGWLDLSSFLKVFVKCTKRNKKDIEGHICVVFWYNNL